LQKRAGTICASTGCDVEASALATIAYSRTFREAAIARPRTVFFRGTAIFTIEPHCRRRLPLSQDHLLEIGIHAGDMILADSKHIERFNWQTDAPHELYQELGWA
jgi:hypothetical protein